MGIIVGGPQILQTWIAGTDLTNYQFHAVKIYSTADQVTIADTAGEECIGILQNAPYTGEEAVVCVLGPTCVAYGGTVAVNGQFCAEVTTADLVANTNTAYYTLGICTKTAADTNIGTGIVTHSGCGDS